MDVEGNDLRRRWDQFSDDERSELMTPLDDVLEGEDGNALLDGLQQAGRDQAALAAMRFEQVHLFRRHREGSADSRRHAADLFARSVRAELAAALDLPERSAEALLARSTMLVEALPATLAALRSGRFSERHAVVLADEAAGLPDDLRGEFEARALFWAERLRVGLFERKVQQLRELLVGEQLAERHDDARRRRDVHVEPGPDGMGWLSAYLPNPELLGIRNKLENIARSLDVEGEERSRAQLRADAVIDLLLDEGRLLPPGTSEAELRAPVKHRGVVAEVSVVVPALTLMGRAAEPGMLEGTVPMDDESARRLAGTASGFTRILTHPETGAVLSFGKDRYQVPPELKRYLRVRDETCRFVGCARPARFCDIDHTVPWADVGETTHTNLAHLCRGHHKVKDAGWQVSQARDGTGRLDWTSPLGREYSTHATAPLGGRLQAQVDWLDDPPPF
ncbi:HNH endonuclease [Herbiconiux sp. SYSU D00978]|uniref:HNH endonuclease n=1 Tax=Herbiconiux sp. SYSU D00978 TaxID=2812562 RepID=UPI001A96467C|nr:HNH endonuclease signature motif containing protein [Herbiconiux sp. SYSU D00978]